MENNEQVVVLYIKSFTWKDKKLAKEFLGHPLEGRVYRGIKDKENNTYRLKVDDELQGELQGLQIDELVGKFPKWACEIEELDEEKLASYDIESEDFLKIQEWTTTKNVDLKPLLNTHLEKNKQLEIREAYPLDESMKTIEEYDSGVYDAIVWFAAMVAGSYTSPDKIETCIDIHTTPSQLGKGANMALSLDRIGQYLNAPMDFPPYVAQSAFYHMLEIARLNLIHER